MKKFNPGTVVLGGSRWRGITLMVGFALMAVALEGRLLYLQAVDKEFLSAQGDSRHLANVNISAHRGPITDRHGEMLAVSTPVDSIGVNPQKIRSAMNRLAELALALDTDEDSLARKITSKSTRSKRKVFESISQATDLAPVADIA